MALLFIFIGYFYTNFKFENEVGHFGSVHTRLPKYLYNYWEKYSQLQHVRRRSPQMDLYSRSPVIVEIFIDILLKTDLIEGLRPGRNCILWLLKYLYNLW